MRIPAGERPITDADSAGMALSRRGPWFASLWLFFLLQPLMVGWAARDTVAGALGIVLTVAFAVGYLWLWIRLRKERAELRTVPPLGFAVVSWLGLAVLGIAMVLSLGESGLTASVYCSISGVMLFGTRVAIAQAGLICAAVVLTGTLAGWGFEIGVVFAICAASLAVWGIRMTLTRNAELIREKERNARLAVENERGRFSRDLHDILGHSLTVITVKAELAHRLFDVDPQRARDEVADLERLARDALTDVRRAVEGYRDLSLSGELARARSSLAAAEIAAVLPNTVDQVSGELQELFAWTIREGVTNVIRHSRASTCEVTLTEGSVRVRDDGVGGADFAAGSGLNGLRERAAAAGATLLTQSAPDGFVLEVTAS